MNAHDAASKNAKLALVRANKAYLRTFEVRSALPIAMGHCPKVEVRKHVEPTRRSAVKAMRCNRWSQTVKLVTSSPRAKLAGRAADVPSMFGKPLARCEG
jgi:hypothetical protein